MLHGVDDDVSLVTFFFSKVLRGMLVNFSSPNFSAAPGNIPIRRSENTRRRLFLFLRVYLRFGNVTFVILYAALVGQLDQASKGTRSAPKSLSMPNGDYRLVFHSADLCPETQS